MSQYIKVGDTFKIPADDVLVSRFYSFLRLDKESECWEWQGAKNKGLKPYGYFQLYDKKNKKRKLAYAHRISWNLHRGEIPHKLCVCHTCDNPMCVNPEHLFLGTYKDNMQDAVKKGRMNEEVQYPKGEKHPHSKLSRDDVLRIRRLKRLGMSNKEIAQEYNIGHNYASLVARGKCWSWLNDNGWGQPF